MSFLSGLDKLEELQSYDADSLAREKDLGTELNFRDAVGPASEIIEMMKLVHVGAAQDFPESIRKNVNEISQRALGLFAKMSVVTPNSGLNAETREALLLDLQKMRETVFKECHSIAAYCSSLSNNAEATKEGIHRFVEHISDQAQSDREGLKLELAEIGKLREAEFAEISKIKDDLKALAAEHGVTQQAIHFHKEWEAQEISAKNWLRVTYGLSLVLIVYAIASLSFHNWSWFAPKDIYGTIQLGVSKFFIFGVLSFLTYLAARNYQAAKHNSIINRHRQNALLTYRAISDAAGGASEQQAVLIMASHCIFAPQSTGFAKEELPSGASAKSVVELLAKPFSDGGASG